MNPKAGKPGNAIPPADPVKADPADEADPGETASAPTGEGQRAGGKAGTTPVTPFRAEEQTGEQKELKWVEMELLGEDGSPIAGESYKIELPDGSVAAGTLDENGLARVEGIPEDGTCRMTFIKLDEDAWEPYEQGSARSGPEPDDSPTDAPADGPIKRPASPEDTKGRWKRVKLGDSAQSLADKEGLFWHTIWNHANNKDLSAARKDPNVLLAGDEIFLPEIREHWEEGPTSQRHTFKRKGIPAILRVQVLKRGEARANEEYRAVIDGTRSVKGVTDGNGVIEHHVPPSAKECVFLVGEDEQRVRVRIGQLPPLSEPRGVQSRLNGLGFSCGREDGVIDERTRSALSGFQDRAGIKVSGEIDDATTGKLQELSASPSAAGFQDSGE